MLKNENAIVALTYKRKGNKDRELLYKKKLEIVNKKKFSEKIFLLLFFFFV